MNKPMIFRAVSALTAIFLCGCGSDSENESAKCTQSYCKDNLLIVCSNGNETALECPFGCENGACIVVDKPCDYTARCAEDGRTLQVCTNGVESTVPCANGCADNACISGEADKTCEYTARCAEDGKTLLTCENGKESTLFCSNGCENNACREVPVTEACKNVVCKEGTCDRGVCVTDRMRAYKTGDDCRESSFVEFCNGDSYVYCYNDEITVVDCSERNGCSLVDYKKDGNLMGFCKGDNAGCSQENDRAFYCKTTKTGASYESFNRCYLNSEGSYTALDAYLYEFASGDCSSSGCDAAGEHCRDKTDPYYCDYDYQCDGSDKFNYCSIYMGVSIKSGTEMCADYGPNAACVNVSGVDYCRNPCTNKGKVTYGCYKNYVEIATCLEDDKGSLYDDVVYKPCDHTCSEGACQTITENEGKTCTDTKYSTCVSSDIGEYCDSKTKKYVAVSCSEEYGEEYVCARVNSATSCVMKCDEVGLVVEVCENGTYNGYAEKRKCVQGTDGTKYWVEESSSPCKGFCNAEKTACAESN